jgi:hypothetical protein
VVVARVTVGDITADRAAVADLRIRDQARRIAEEGDALAQQVRRDQVIFNRHGADHHGVCVRDRCPANRQCR